MLNVIMLYVVKLNVIMLSVVAKHSSMYNFYISDEENTLVAMIHMLTK